MRKQRLKAVRPPPARGLVPVSRRSRGAHEHKGIGRTELPASPRWPRAQATTPSLQR
jgi:hypothetical protein